VSNVGVVWMMLGADDIGDGGTMSTVPRVCHIFSESESLSESSSD
jgi:hypothetical protein